MQRRAPSFSSWDRPAYDFDEPEPNPQRTRWDLPQRHDRRALVQLDMPRGMKMDPPYFDGSDTPSWIARVQYYFDHLQLPDADRLHYVVMLFHPPASEWIFNYRANNRIVSWSDFLEDVRHHFDPHSFRNFIGPLSKLVQTDTVAEYQATFERYSNRIDGLPESALIPMFIARFKEPIQEKVELQQPTSLAAAMALASHLAVSQDERAAQRNHRRDSRPHTSAATAPSQPTATIPSSARDAPRSSSTPIRLSISEKSERAKRELCFYCPEKWVWGHVCQSKLLAYFGEEDIEPMNQDEERLSDDEVIADDLSHLKALQISGQSWPFRVHGSLGNAAVSIMLDTGSTHDFLHFHIAVVLNLPLTPVKPFRVYVGNGDTITCSYIAHNCKLTIQEVDFSIYLHILDIHGSDIILGMAWLESLGKVFAYFVGKTLEFKRGTTSYTIRGSQPSPRQISLQSLFLLSSHSSDHEFYELVLLEEESSASSSVEVVFPPT